MLKEQPKKQVMPIWRLFADLFMRERREKAWLGEKGLDHVPEPNSKFVHRITPTGSTRLTTRGRFRPAPASQLRALFKSSVWFIYLHADDE